MKLRQTHPIEVAAAKADISRATGYRIAQDPRLPSQKAQLSPTNLIQFLPYRQAWCRRICGGRRS